MRCSFPTAHFRRPSEPQKPPPPPQPQQKQPTQQHPPKPPPPTPPTQTFLLSFSPAVTPLSLQDLLLLRAGSGHLFTNESRAFPFSGCYCSSECRPHNPPLFSLPSWLSSDDFSSVASHFQIPDLLAVISSAVPTSQVMTQGGQIAFYIFPQILTRGLSPPHNLRPYMGGGPFDLQSRNAPCGQDSTLPFPDYHAPPIPDFSPFPVRRGFSFL